MGNPINPIVWLANKMAEIDDYLRAGEIIISGSVVTPIEYRLEITLISRLLEWGE
ncbi:MAG: hypothetical protein Ct9H300mP11_05910 [Chloroflexota bacterium]|nr:MAG: hypothetical protein Ct9H300mP11_05910 [Chloroflexota bacterium]